MILVIENELYGNMNLFNVTNLEKKPSEQVPGNINGLISAKFVIDTINKDKIVVSDYLKKGIVVVSM